MSKRQQIIDTLNRIKRRYPQLPKIDIDFLAGRPRLILADNSRYISPRLKSSDMVNWIDGFEVALQEIAEKGFINRDSK